MTGRGSSRTGSDPLARNPAPRHGNRPTDFAVAVRKLRLQVATARLAGKLTAGERRALTGLIATVARLLDEEEPEA
jgi:hypothetical protein